MLPLLAEDIYEWKLYGMFAAVLRCRGWRVVALASCSVPAAVQYARAFGFTEMVWWEEVHITREERAATMRAGAQFLTNELTFPAVKSWRYRGCRIGPQVLSAVSRGTFRGALDPRDPAVRDRVATVLTGALETVHRAERAMAVLRPQMLLVVEANYATFGPLVDVAIASGVNVIQITQPSRDDALICKRLTATSCGLHPNSLSRESLDAIASHPWSEAMGCALVKEIDQRYDGTWFLQGRNQPGARPRSRGEIMRELHLDPAKPIAVVFSHVLWDANLFYGEDLFEDYGDWFVQTVRAACANPHVNWIVKLHPANVWKRARERVTSELSEVQLIRQHIGDLPTHVQLLYPDSTISTRSLFETIDYAVTVRGTTGMEAACFGVRVFTAGTGRYSGLGFTTDSSSKEEYLERMAEIHQYGCLSEAELLRAKQHAYGVFCLRPWTMRSFRSVFVHRERGAHPLDANLRCVARFVEEMRQNGDLDCWADWAEGTDVDYLASDVRSAVPSISQNM
jgi:hypothetical protein